MNSIIVDYDPFAMESRVYTLIDGKQENTSVCSEPTELAATLIALAYKHDIYSVRIRAPFATTNEFRRMIQDCEKHLYSVNKIDVEGI